MPLRLRLFSSEVCIFYILVCSVCALLSAFVLRCGFSVCYCGLFRVLDLVVDVWGCSAYLLGFDLGWGLQRLGCL